MELELSTNVVKRSEKRVALQYTYIACILKCIAETVFTIFRSIIYAILVFHYLSCVCS